MAVRDELRTVGLGRAMLKEGTCTALRSTLDFDLMAVFSPVQLIASVPPLTRFFTLTTVFLSLFYIYLQWKSDATYPVPYLTLVPGTSLFYPWTFFTSVFVETTIYEVCCHSHSQRNYSSDASF